MQATRINPNPTAKQTKAITETKQPVPGWDAIELTNVLSLLIAAIARGNSVRISPSLNAPSGVLTTNPFLSAALASISTVPSSANTVRRF